MLVSIYLNGQYSFNSNQYKTFTSLEEALKNPTNVFHLDLSHQALGDIPKEIIQFKNLESLILINNDLKNINIDFSFFPNLRILDLKNNQLTNLPFESLSYCSELQLVSIRENKFKAITKDWNQLKYVEILDLGGNFIEDISEELNLKYLNTFKADDNELQHFPIGLENSPKLKSLNLNRNTFQTIPTIFQNLKSLEKLDLGNNELDDITSLQQLSKLRTLILDWTTLNEEDVKALTQLKKLEILSLEHCKIKKLPESIGNLKHLQELSLIYNELENVPEEIKKLKHLKRMWIGNNNFTNSNYLICQNLIPRCEVIFP